VKFNILLKKITDKRKKKYENVAKLYQIHYSKWKFFIENYWDGWSNLWKSDTKLTVGCEKLLKWNKSLIFEIKISQKFICKF